MTTYGLAAVIQKGEDSYYPFWLRLQCCYASGDTFGEARANLADGEDLKGAESFYPTAVEVAV